MAKYHVKGVVYVWVKRMDLETERIDDEFEADNEREAQRLAEQMAEDEYNDCMDADVDSSSLTFTIIEESEEERTERERLAIYHAMVASGAPQLPGMEIAK